MTDVGLIDRTYPNDDPLVANLMGIWHLKYDAWVRYVAAPEIEYGEQMVLNIPYDDVDAWVANFLSETTEWRFHDAWYDAEPFHTWEHTSARGSQVFEYRIRFRKRKIEQPPTHSIALDNVRRTVMEIRRVTS